MSANRVEEALKDALRESFKGRFKERRRSKIEIIADILTAARSEAKKTEIVYRTNLNFARIQRYLPFLEKRGLITNSGAVYKTTEKGEEFLHEYERMAENFFI